MSRPKNNKSLRIIKTMRELRNLEDAIEEINQLEESETEIVIESRKRKYSVIQKQKIIKINELKEDFGILTVNRRMKEKPESFKMKNKEIARSRSNRIRERIKSRNNKQCRKIKTRNIKRNIKKKF